MSKPTHSCFVAFLIVTMAMVYSTPGAAQTNTTWTDGTGNWSNPLNWDSGVPNGNYNAIFNTGSTARTITLDTSVSINSLQLDTNASPGMDTLSIAPGNTLTLQPVGSSASRNGGAIQINGGSSLTLDTLGLTGTPPFGLAFINSPGHLNINDGGTFTILGALNSTTRVALNSVALNSTGSLTSIQLNGEDLTVVEPFKDTIRLSDNSNNLITGVTGTETLVGVSITGAGSITNLHLVIPSGDGQLIANGTNPLIITPNSQGLENLGDLYVASGSTMFVNGLMNNLDGGFMGVESGGTMVISGPLNSIGPHVVVAVGGTLTTGDFTNSGYVPIGGTLNVNGVLNNSGTVGLLGSGLLSVSGDLNNTGTVSLGNSDAVRVGGSFNNGTSGILALQQNGGTVIAGQFNNAGTVQVGTGNSLVVNGGQPFTSTAGQVVVNGILVSPGGVKIQGGTLSGTGIVDGNVTMAGTMSPGDAPGTFTINGNYTQTSQGTLVEQVGWINGYTGSLLQLNGVANLDGTLSLSLLSGYNPTVGDSFILMTFFQEYGSFNTITGLNLGNNEHLDLVYDPHDIRVEVETPEPGSAFLLLVGVLAILAFYNKRVVMAALR